MKALAAGLIGLIIGAALSAGGLIWFHHHGPHQKGGRHHGHHDCEKAAPAPAAAEEAPAAASKPAYLVVLGEVYDREKFMNEYSAKLPPLYEKFGGQYIALGRNFEVFEGAGNFKSFVIAKWPSMEAARAFWNSPDYDALRRARIDGNWGRFDVYAFEGLETPVAAAASAQPPK